MKRLLFALFAIVSIMSMSRCTKSADVVSKTDTLLQLNYDTVYVVPKDTFPITGFWIGNQIPEDGSSTDPLYFTMDVQPDGTVQTSGLGSDGNTYYSKGTWTLNGTVFSATVFVVRSTQAGLRQNLTATYNPANGTITGGELVNVGTTYHGSFTFARVN